MVAPKNAWHRKVTKKALLDLIADGYATAAEMAPVLGVSERTVRRNLVDFGLVEKRPVRVVSFEDLARIEIMTAEGVPATWIAEDLGLAPETVRDYSRDMPGARERNTEWKRTWAWMTHHPHLVELHRQIAPRERVVA